MTCNRPDCHKRTRNPTTELCEQHRIAEYYARNPVRRAYANLKSSAKRRGKPFDISYDHFVRFCEETKYLELKGRGTEGYSIDCVCNGLGYTEGNIRVVTVGENAAKGARPTDTPIDVSDIIPTNAISNEEPPF